MRKSDSIAGKKRREKTARRAGKRYTPRLEGFRPAGVVADGRHPHRQVRASGIYTTIGEAVRGSPGASPWLERLAGAGIDAGGFAELARGHRSAWALARKALWSEDDEPAALTTKAIFATLLWEKYLPERPSMERIDDLLEEGCEHLEAGAREAALRAWVACWQALKAAAPPEAVRNELDGFLMTLRFSEWLEVFEAEAAAPIEDEALAAAVQEARGELLARA